MILPEHPDPCPEAERGRHWLVQPATIRKLWIALVAVLALTLLAGLGVHQHEAFGFEDRFGFYGLYGFGVCVAMVVVAKVLGIFLKRQERYYQRPDTGPGVDPVAAEPPQEEQG